MAPAGGEVKGPMPPPAAAQHLGPLPFRLLPTAPSSWDPATANVTLNLRLDGCIVPSEASEEGARIAYSHAVVLDDFVDDATRQQLLDFLLHSAASEPTDGSAASEDSAALRPAVTQERKEGVSAGGTSSNTALLQDVQQPQQAQQQHQRQQLPLPFESGRWERCTTDMAGAAPTWGVKQHVLRELAEGRLPALREVHARLCKLYPECDIAHLPSEAIQQAQQQQQQRQQQERHCEYVEERQQGQQQVAAGVSQDPQHPPAKRSRLSGDSAATSGGLIDGGGDTSQPAVDCACFVANAAMEGDSFRYHVDADPTSFPDGSPWHAAYGDYFNGEPGRPLLVSLLLYLNPEWRREWGADTLFLDGQTDTGFFVVPRPCRAVLLDQDITHRVTPPSAAAGGLPRFSLVWKLAFLPRHPGQALCLARPEWGPPISFGSAARVDAVKRQLAAQRHNAA